MFEPLNNPFLLRGAIQISGLSALNRGIEPIIERLFGLHRLAALYDDVPTDARESPDDFLNHVLDLFQIKTNVNPVKLERIPASGSALVVANHPFGALDGMILAFLLRQIRPDVRILANHYLMRIPELSDLFIPVDPFEGENSIRRNVAPLREAKRWLDNGGLLAMFPAGEISHLHWRKRMITDRSWSPLVARLARKGNIPVVPVHFSGRNSWTFQIAGVVNPILRTALIPREFINKTEKTISVAIGKPIDFRTLSDLDDRTIAEQLRVQTYLTGARNGTQRQQSAVGDTVNRDGKPVINSIPSNLLEAEVSALPAHQLLTTSGSMQVWRAQAEQIPWTMREIGRLRELTFREAGEGTGLECDLDVFDNYYHHLFIWNTESREVVGAYRLGLADQIINRFGLKGLYSYTLFRYRNELLNRINPAIELGRSFVRSEYQRNFTPLLLLWKGIGHFVKERPRYRYLFGPVSISNDYDTVSRSMLVSFLHANRFDTDLARLVKPRMPFVKRLPRETGELRFVSDIDEISKLISHVEDDGKGLPILIKQYLKLGGKLLGFNLDPEFQDALDGLIMVDLLATDQKVLAKYMGTDGVARLHAEHNSTTIHHRQAS